METTALIKAMQPSDVTTTVRQVQQRDDEAPSRRRQQPGGHGAPIILPEDQITLSETATETRQRSEPVSSNEKAALLGQQKVARFSVRV